MADVRPFRGFRYNLGQVGSLADVIAPPYDVIDDPLHVKLLAASEYNAVRVELPLEPNGGGPDKYTLAARTLNGWLQSDAIRQDTARALYVLEQEFTADGVTHTRRGFLARVRLDPLGSGRIYPHEQTLAGPKADRLRLYQATAFNVSPVFGLYPDPANEVFALLDPFISTAPPTTAVDPLGVTHRMWLITDQKTVSRVTGLMGPRPVFLADGHHRYETAIRYRDELAASARPEADSDGPANFCLMHLVGMSAPGLIVRPTHRMLAGLPAVTAAALKQALADHFVTVADFGPDAAGCWDHVQLEESQSVLGFGAAGGREWFAARFTTPTAVEALAPDHSPEWRELAVSVLHELVVGKLLPAAFGAAPTCRYGHLLDEVTASLTGGESQVGVLVPPVGMDHVEMIAGNRETMPPKTTYFYPKVPTGLVFNSLKRD